MTVYEGRPSHRAGPPGNFSPLQIDSCSSHGTYTARDRSARSAASGGDSMTTDDTFPLCDDDVGDTRSSIDYGPYAEDVVTPPMAAVCASGAAHYGSKKRVVPPMGVAPAIVKPVHRTKRSMQHTAAAAAVIGHERESPIQTVVAEYERSGRVIASAMCANDTHLRTAAAALGECFASSPYSSADADHNASCGAECTRRLGDMGCSGLDPADVEESMRLRLASDEEAHDRALARRVIGAVQRLVLDGSLKGACVCRPLWRDSACVRCAAMSCDSRVNEPQPDGPSTLRTLGERKRMHIESLCVYMASVDSKGRLSWRVGLHQKSLRHDAVDDNGSHSSSPPPPLPPLSSMSNRSVDGGRRCALCSAGIRMPGVSPSVRRDGWTDVDAEFEVVGAVAANLSEGIACPFIGIDPTGRRFALWSGISESPLSSAAQEPALARAWLTSEVDALVGDATAVAARGVPMDGCDALRMCARMDRPKAVTAAAHKLARLIYAMLTNGEEYTDRGQDYFEERYRQRVLHNLAQKAKAMGMQLVPSQSVT